MSKTRPYVMSIAGFDPSGGAGLAADLKTFESLKTLGLGICTANTIQNESEFEEVIWTETDVIIRQIECLAKKHRPKVAKIGIIENLEVLEKILDTLESNYKGIKIIWDPILSASAGFQFHSASDFDRMDKILRRITLLSPNLDELRTLSGKHGIQDTLTRWSAECSIFLKGGHSEEEPGKDYLYSGKKVYPFRPRGKRVSPKHGSGCVLSAAIASSIARGSSLPNACLKGKEYVTRYLESTPGLLGLHK